MRFVGADVHGTSVVRPSPHCRYQVILRIVDDERNIISGAGIFHDPSHGLDVVGNCKATPTLQFDMIIPAKDISLIPYMPDIGVIPVHIEDLAFGRKMAKTTWKVISYYEGTQTVQEILVDLIAEKIRREKSNKEVEKNDERVYNLGMSYGDDLPGLAG